VTGSRNRTLTLTFVTVFVLLVTEAWGAADLSASYLQRQVQRARRKIHHVVIIMQENRSFDSYFGTFPGVDGIPMKKGVLRAHRIGDTHRRQEGLVAVCSGPDDPSGRGGPDVMGYHDQRESPNYWAYARHYVLQDHMCQPDASWSLPAH